MKKSIFIFIFTLFCTFSLKSQTDLSQAAHQWVTFQAWELIKNYNHPEVQYSDMNSKIGSYDDLGPSADWITGKVIAGSWREDATDIVYHITGLCSYGHTSTHFWDADYGDNQTFTISGCTYNNSFDKVTKLWNGNYDLSIFTDC